MIAHAVHRLCDVLPACHDYQQTPPCFYWGHLAAFSDSSHWANSHRGKCTSQWAQKQEPGAELWAECKPVCADGLAGDCSVLGVHLYRLLQALGHTCTKSTLPFLSGVLRQAVCSFCKTQAVNQHSHEEVVMLRGNTRPPWDHKLVIKQLQRHLKIREAKK